jgi:restriction system protein
MLWLLKKLCYYSWLGIIAAYAVWVVSRIPLRYSIICFAVLVFFARAVRTRLDEQADRLTDNDVSSLSPLAYEDYCALVLRDAGWHARTTPLQDQGADVVAVLRGTKAVIQCKMYTRPVGNRAVQEVIAGKMYYGAQIAVVVSPASYTFSAMDLASRTQVLLLHHDQLHLLDRLAKVR